MIRAIRLPVGVRDRIAGLVFGVLVVLSAIAFTWTVREAWAVHKLQRGVGDTWFSGADGRAWFRLDEQRQDVPLSAIPVNLQNAFVAVEDHRFFRHPGVDPIALGRALLRNIRSSGRVEGGSTLTQQLARTLFLSNRKSYGRKIREAALALMIDAELSKQQVLELYLNRIYLSAGVYGVETMSRHLFQRPAKTLSLAECALIAGLARAPAGLSPWNQPPGGARAQPRRPDEDAGRGVHHRRPGTRGAGGADPDSAVPAARRAARRLCQGVPAAAVPGGLRRRSPAGLECADDVRSGPAGGGRGGGVGRPAAVQ